MTAAATASSTVEAASATSHVAMEATTAAHVAARAAVTAAKIGACCGRIGESAVLPAKIALARLGITSWGLLREAVRRIVVGSVVRAGSVVNRALLEVVVGAIRVGKGMAFIADYAMVAIRKTVLLIGNDAMAAVVRKSMLTVIRESVIAVVCKSTIAEITATEICRPVEVVFRTIGKAGPARASVKATDWTVVDIAETATATKVVVAPVVAEVTVVPISAIKTGAKVPEAIIDAAIIANGGAPVTGVPEVAATTPTQ